MPHDSRHAGDNTFDDGALTRVVRMSSSVCDRPMPHVVTHTHAALAYATAGRAVVEQGTRFVIEPGDVLLVPAGQPHRTIESGSRSFYGLGFCATCLIADGGADLLAPFERVRDGASAVARIAPERRAFFESILDELAALTRERPPSPARAVVERGFLTIVLHEVERAVQGRGRDVSTPSGVVTDAIRYIERNCLRRLTVDEVARAIGRSPTYVTQALTRATGRSAVAWITSFRMSEARRRLAHTDEHVDVLGERVGYADPTHFIRVFRREHGVTPAAWRASSSSRTREAPSPIE